MRVYEIPLAPLAQTFAIMLGGQRYRMTLLWRETANGGWFLDLADSSAVPLVQGIPLVCGVDLLAPYPQLQFGGRLLVASGSAPYDAPPAYGTLGATSHLYFVVPG